MELGMKKKYPHSGIHRKNLWPIINLCRYLLFTLTWLSVCYSHEIKIKIKFIFF